jgi:Helicase-associated putative binding domain, C-terminal
MGGSKSRKSKSMGEDWVAEAEAKGPKDKEDVSSQSRSFYGEKLISSFYRGIYEALEPYYLTMVKAYFLWFAFMKLSACRMVAPPPAESREQDVIQKTLNAIGVMYSHHNDEILVPSRIEEERTKKMLVRGIFWILSSPAHDPQKTRRRMSTPSSPARGSASAQWPPKRRHHKPPLTPEQQYVIRGYPVISPF